MSRATSSYKVYSAHFFNKTKTHRSKTIVKVEHALKNNSWKGKQSIFRVESSLLSQFALTCFQYSVRLHSF